MTFRTGLSVLIAVSLLYPAAAAPQAWVTTESCKVTSSEITSDGIEAATRAKFEITASGIENSTGRLWRITSAEGAVSHLWGTIHSNDPMMLNLPDQL